MQIRKIKGFADILYPESGLYTEIEHIARTLFSLYMYEEIRIPIVEYTDLFVRGIGISTDVVQKEMYTFQDRKGRSITLRPEATAGIARAYIEHNVKKIFRVFTIGPMFRYERPQKGRMRQFHQINCECLGVEEPTADAEIIAMLLHFLQAIGITDITLLLNSLGCPECRLRYKEALLAYVDSISNELCTTCQDRKEHNPLRILDCKEENCIHYTQDAPSIIEYICDDCREHFVCVQELLTTLSIPYVIEPRLVRGLDYYSRTTFEVLSQHIGSQSSIAGGGRYDTLLKQREVVKILYYIAPLCIQAQKQALLLAEQLRMHGIPIEVSFTVVTMKQCMKYAGKYADYCIFIGEDELSHGACSIKNMKTGIQELVSFEQCVHYCTSHAQDFL